jgi:hypothetical protein
VAVAKLANFSEAIEIGLEIETHERDASI